MNQRSEHISGQPLLAFFAGDYRRLSLQEKAGLIAAFAGFLRSLGGGLGLEALRDIRVAGGPSGWQFARGDIEARGQTAIAVAALFLTGASRNEKMRFCRSYLELSRPLKYSRLDLQTLELKAIDLMARGEWRMLGRQVAGGGGDFCCERRQGFVVRYARGSEAARLLELIFPDPQRLFSQGSPLPGRGLGCASVRIEVEGKTYFFKRYDDKGLVDRWVGLFKKSRGMRVWSTGWGGVARGLPLPRPVILVEETDGLLVGRSWLITEYVEGMIPLMQRWLELSPAMRNDLLVRSAILLGRMHRLGLLHGDTNWDNLLVGEGDVPQQLLLVDFDCGRLAALSDARAFRDIQHFVRDLMRTKNEGDAGQRDFFVGVWKRWFFPRDPLAPCFLRGFRYRNAKP